MTRFCGLLPENEVKKIVEYAVGDKTVKIQAGETGWTIIWADGGTSYKDVEANTQVNFNEAYAKLQEWVKDNNELTGGSDSLMMISYYADKDVPDGFGGGFGGGLPMF